MQAVAQMFEEVAFSSPSISNGPTGPRLIFVQSETRLGISSNFRLGATISSMIRRSIRISDTIISYCGFGPGTARPADCAVQLQFGCDIRLNLSNAAPIFAKRLDEAIEALRMKVSRAGARESAHGRLNSRDGDDRVAQFSAAAWLRS
jgi:hypothetical protein